MAFQWSLAALETLMAEDQMDQHGAVLRAFSVVELWRLRRVCRAFHRWGTAALSALPRIAVVGGDNEDGEQMAGVEVLDLSTLRWSLGVVPALPEPRCAHSACCFEDGRVVVAGGGLHADASSRTVLQWAPGAPDWAPLPDMAEARQGAVTVALPDGLPGAEPALHLALDPHIVADILVGNPIADHLSGIRRLCRDCII